MTFEMKSGNEIRSDEKTRKYKGRREQIILYAPLFIWICVILFLGSGQGSMTRTSLIIRPLLEFLFPTATEETLQIYHGLIRKCAHLTEYAVLGFLATRALIRSFRIGKAVLLAAGLVVFVAATDEMIQSLNPERTGAAIDVLIDLSGGLAAILVYSLLRRRTKTTAE